MPNLYLVGFMGAGKSSVGKALARRVGYDFVDLDEYIEEEMGMSIQNLFDRFGEAHFRVAERQALQWTTALNRTVVATGGGAFCSAANRELIQAAGGLSLFLDLPWEVVAARLRGDQSERPKFVSMDAARKLYTERRPHYLSATWRLEVEGSETPEETAWRIEALVTGAACAT